MHSLNPIRASLDRLKKFSQSIHMYRTVSQITIEPKQSFWIITTNLLFEAAVVEWSKVFGSKEEDTHWTKVTPVEMHAKIRDGLHEAIGLTEKEWKIYWNSIVEYRNQVVSHHDLSLTVAKIPEFDIGIIAANYMFDCIRNFAKQNDLEEIPNSLETWSNTVTGNMNAIVKKAFEASALLGANVK